MDCPRCGGHNETDVGSCLSCGAPLHFEDPDVPTIAQKQPGAQKAAGQRLAGGAPPRQCPNCMTLNAATFKFCARCGTPLTASGQAAAKSAAAPPSTGARPAAKPAPARPSPPPPPKPVAGPQRPAVATQTAPQKPRARVSAIARDGSRSADFVLTSDETRVGRAVKDGEVKLEKDPFIAPLHAVFKFEGAQLTVRDSGSPNGVFVQCKERRLEPGDELRIGRQRLRVEWMPEEPETLSDEPLWGSPDPGYTARVVQVFEGGGEGDVFPLKPGENLVGRGTGDVSFPADGYVSSKHATITVGRESIDVKDLGSANGTFVKVHGAANVSSGDLLLVGEQILRVDPA